MRLRALSFATARNRSHGLLLKSPLFLLKVVNHGWKWRRPISAAVDHILTGFDHLLFVLALMLLIHDRWMLVKTVTAFTIAHSITLAGATLGYISLPQKPSRPQSRLASRSWRANSSRRDQAKGEFGGLSLDCRFRIRISSRLWFCRRSQGDRVASDGYLPRTPHIQSRGGGRTAHVHCRSTGRL